jgi:hypothetical protein
MAFDKIRTHTFREKLFHIFWRRYRRSADEVPGKNCGYCDHRETPNPKMYVYPDKDDLELLLTLAHESFHAAVSDVSDDAVAEWEADFGRMLRRMKVEVKFHGR